MKFNPTRVLRFLGVEEVGNLDRLLARASFASLAVKVGGAGLTFLLQMVLARVLGPAGYGDYAYALTWVALLSLVCTAGLETAAVRFIGGYGGTGRWSELRGFLERSTGIVLTLSLAAGVLMAGVSWILRDTLGVELALVFAVAALLLPVNVLQRLASAFLRGFKRVVAATAPTALLRPLLLGGAVLAVAVMTGTGVEARAAVLLNVGAAAVVLGLMALIFRRSVPEPVRNAAPTHETRKWVTVALPLLLLAGMHLLIVRTDILMIGALVGTEEAGIYTVGSRAAELAGFGLGAANLIVAPLIAELYARSEMEKLQRIVRLSATGSFLFALAVGGGLLLLGRPLLGLFGEAFTRAYLPMLILCCAQTVGAFVGSVGYLMTMTGNERSMALVLAGSAVLNIILNWLLIPHWGLEGAAVATSASFVAWNLILAWLAGRLLGVRASPLVR